MVFEGKHTVRSKFVFDEPTEQIRRFNYLRQNILIFENEDLGTRLSKFGHIWWMTRRVSNKTTRKEMHIKFYKTTDRCKNVNKHVLERKFNFILYGGLSVHIPVQ
jgi:hypothetical protein